MSDIKWQEVRGNSDFHDFDSEPILEGKYVKLEENVGANKSNVYHIEATEGDETIKVWGCTVLDDRFANIPIGTMVQIELKNKVPNRYGNLTLIYAVRVPVNVEKDNIPVVD